MKLVAEGRCGRGLIRKENQDHIFVNGQWRENRTDVYRCKDIAEKGIYAVCDGMGGEQWGEEAARIAVMCLKSIDVETKSVQDGLFEANYRICELMRERENVRIGTTAVVFVVSDGIGKIYNIGDSRAYIYRCNTLQQLSHDHNQAQQMVDMGVLTKEQAREHPARHRLTQHLGILPEEFEISPFVYDDFELHSGEFVLLCSDGLTEMLTDSEICLCLQTSISLTEKADALFVDAMQCGGKDNISIILIECV